MSLRFLPALLCGQLLFSSAAYAQTIIDKPATISGLTEAWEWGLSEIGSQNDAWMAYGFTTQLDEKFEVGLTSRHEHFIEWNRSHRGRWGSDWYNSETGGWRNRHSLASLQAGTTAPQDEFVVPKDLVLLARYEGNVAQEIRLVAQDALINWYDLPVYWLGEISQEESFEHIQSLLSPLNSDDIQRTLVRSLGLHNVSGKDDILTNLISDENETAIRLAALESLAIQKSTSAASVLTQIARNENEGLAARRIAISALSRYNDAAILQLLSELSSPLNPQAVRREAIESLALNPGEASSEILRELVAIDEDWHVVIAALVGLSNRASEYNTIADVAEDHDNYEVRVIALELAANMDGERAFPLLQRLVERDPNEDVREEALRAMDEVPAQLAVPYLLEVADEPGAIAEDLRAEAVETLSEFDASMVLTGLNRLAWSDGNEDVRENAVRALAELDDPTIGNLLLEIARNHPSQHTRREAMDELEDRVL